MHAFFAMIWNEKDAQAARTASMLRAKVHASLGASPRRLEASGFVLYQLAEFQGGPSLLALNDGEARPLGAVFGTLFERSGVLADQSPVKRLAADATTTLRKSEGRSIVKDYWGSYVAFIRCDDTFVVVADPTSSIPCFYAEHGGVTLIFSHLEPCTFLDKSLFTINYGFISKVLAYDRIQNGETGLNEVRELLGGERLRITETGLSTDFIWDPSQIALDVHEPSLADAAAELRETTQAVVSVWSRCFDSVTVNLSGGLDSSIVLACLAQADRSGPVNAAHFIKDSSDAPENQYARAMADHAGFELIEMLESPHEPLPGVHEHPATTRPYRQFIVHDAVTRIASRSEEFGAALFTGQGGDHLFLESRSTLGFADYLKNHRFPRNAFAQLLHAARLSDTSIWNVLRECLPYTFGRSYRSASAEGIDAHKTDVNRRAFENLVAEDSLPTWARQARDLPPAKFSQVCSLAHLYQVRDPMFRSEPREVVHPLVSQPLIELCLRLPTYLLCAEGRSRGLARVAFSSYLPDRVRLRTHKGGATKFYTEYLRLNSNKVIEALSDGQLASKGMITRAEVEAFVERNDYKIRNFGFMMLPYYSIEAWLRTWKVGTGNASKAA